MPIEFKCPNCSKAIKAPDAYAGKTAKCPGCGNAITVPAMEEEIVEAEAVDPVPETDALADMLNEEDEYKVANPYQAPAPPAERRMPCPACGEMIPTNAALCRFCGEVFDPALKRAREQKSRSSDDDDMTAIDWVLTALPVILVIGCIVGIVYMVMGKKKGGKMILVSICACVIWNILIGVLTSLGQHH